MVKNTKPTGPKLFFVCFNGGFACLPLTTSFSLFRCWRKKLTRRENGTKLRTLTFDLNLLRAPTSAHQFCLHNYFYVVSWSMQASFFHGSMMAQQVISHQKLLKRASGWYFKPIFCYAPMVSRPFSFLIGMLPIRLFKNCLLFVGQMLAK